MAQLHLILLEQSKLCFMQTHRNSLLKKKTEFLLLSILFDTVAADFQKINSTFNNQDLSSIKPRYN